MSESLNFAPTEAISASPTRVLAESEMALVLKTYNPNGTSHEEHLNEIGNPSYGRNRQIFHYHPEIGLEIQRLTGRSALIEPTDLVRLPHGKGHIPVSRAFGREERQFTEAGFFEAVRNERDSVDRRIEKIAAIAEVTTGRPRYEFERAVETVVMSRAASADHNYSPELLLEQTLEYLEQILPRELEHEYIGDSLRRLNVLSADSNTQREGVVGYVYTWGRLAGIDMSDSLAIREGFSRLPPQVLDELMEEYRRKGDIRFGDGLIMACLEYDMQLQKETEEESL